MNTQVALAAAALAGSNVELVVVTAAMMEDKAFKAKNVTMSFPLLEVDDLVLFDVLAITKYFAKVAPEKALAGSSALESALIEMWLQRAVT